jgi:hypothetical protein
VSWRVADPASATRPPRRRDVLLVFALLAAVSSALLLRAALLPPPGTVFVGTFYYVDDFYNYLSYVQQAEDGALAFASKLASPRLPPSLVNLEWLAVGWTSRLLGRHSLVAYRLFGLAGALLLVALVARWLDEAGIAPRHRRAGLLLVFTGGGLGGVLAALGVISPDRALDVRAGLFPFVEVLANPHFVAGTALLLASLLAFARGRPGTGILLGTTLGLVRPYETVLLVSVVGLAVVLDRPRDEWPRRLLPLLGLFPVIAWNAWLFLAGPGFGSFSSAHYAAVHPPAWELALALGPAGILALSIWRLPPADEGTRIRRLMLGSWAVLALAVGVTRPVAFSLQLLVGVGVPLLALAAVSLSYARRGALEAAVVALAGTAVYVVWLVASPGPPWHVPASRWNAAIRLRAVCHRGDVVVAPPDIGLYVGGLTACWPWVSHAAAADHVERDAAARRFYSDEPGSWRTAFLDDACARAVVFSADDAGERPGWSAEGDGFRLLPGKAGPFPQARVYVRDRAPAGCN